MKILRFFTIRIILLAGLLVALALPTGADAKTVTKTTTKKVAHKTSTHKAGKKTVHKVAKPATKRVTITGKYVSGAKDGINVLADPTTDAEVRWEIFNKFPLMVKKRQGSWLQVTDFEGDTGWIQDSLVTGDKSVIVCKKRINLRQNPSTDNNNPVVAVVRYGVVFTPLEKKDDWLKVRYADKTEGWLKKDLVWPTNPLD